MIFSAPMEEVQLLELRQQLKNNFRDTLKKEAVASVCDGHRKNKRLPFDDYGSFFGHSQPSIARRLLQESDTMVEVRQLATKLMMNSHHNCKENHVSTAAEAKPGMQEWKITARKLKASRDYSCIFSDHAENLVSSMEKGSKKNPGSGVERISFSTSIKTEHVIERKKNSEPKKAKLKTNQLNKAAEEQLHSMSMPKLQEVNKGRLAQNRKYTEACNVELMQKQVKTATRHHTPDAHEASFPRSSIGGKRKYEEKIEIFESKKAKVMQNQTRSSVKDVRNPTKGKVISSQATKSHSKHQIKRPMHEFCYDHEVNDSYISSLCQSLFRRNHSKRVENNDYDDAECMVSNFNDIQKEERKSAKIARKEDQLEQLRLEQEEEEERLRIKAKKQKQQQN